MRILMITQSTFPVDIRVEQEAYTLAEHGHRVSVIALRFKDQLPFERMRGVNVYRIPKLRLTKKAPKDNQISLRSPSTSKFIGVLNYSMDYLYFTISALVYSFIIYFREGFSVVHVHNPPDTLFAIALFYKLLGKKFVFDHHDLSPDLFTYHFNSYSKFILTRCAIQIPAHDF